MSTDEDKERGAKKEYIAAGLGAGKTIAPSLKRMEETYKKPLYNPENRQKYYDDGRAKRIAKEKVFQSGKKVKDPYSGKSLELRKQDAKLKYGSSWQEHLAESDHIDPLNKVYKEHKDSPLLTTKDINEVANSQDNLQVISRKNNNLKRDRTNEEFYGDEDYLRKKGIHLSKKGRKKAIEDGKRAEEKIKWKMRTRQVQNAVREFHVAGIEAAKSGAIMGGSMAVADNFIAVLRGEKEPDDAMKDIALTTGKTAAVSYVTGGTVSVATQILSKSSSEMVKALTKSGAPGKVVAAVIATSGTFKRYFSGKISTEECLVELGETGINIAAAGVYGAIGQVAIPIPVVGGVIGMTVGTLIVGSSLNVLSQQMQATKMVREERIRTEKECAAAIEQIRSYRIV